jgi:hypothetical protein
MHIAIRRRAMYSIIFYKDFYATFMMLKNSGNRWDYIVLPVGKD